MEGQSGQEHVFLLPCQHQVLQIIFQAQHALGAVSVMPSTVVNIRFMAGGFCECRTLDTLAF